MTDAPREQDKDVPEYEGAHEGPIKTPRQLIIAVLWAHIIPIGGILLLATFVVAQMRPSAGSDAQTPASIAQRLKPVGHVEVRDATDVGAMKSGEQVFAAQCAACHTAGVAGAPKFGDAAAWGPRLAQGFDALLHSALKGKGAMGPQGGGDFSDFEIARAVVYMANAGGGKFEEPKAPSASANTAAAAPAADAGAAAAVASAQAAMANVSTAAKPTAAAGAQPAAAAGAQTAGASAGAAPALYTQACQVCHAAGVAGAPKFGDKAQWAPRLAQGVDGLTASAIKGKGAMPPRGGSQGTDEEIKAAVVYMVNAVK